jgi:putative ABC transport system permease protein
VLVTVGLAASLLTASALTDTAKAALNRPPVAAEHMVVPTGGGGLDREVVRALPGAALSTPTSLYTLESETALTRRQAFAVTWVPDDAIVAAPDLELPVGSTAHVWLADGSPASLRVIGVLPLGSPSDALVGAGNAFSALPSVAYISGNIMIPPGHNARLSDFSERSDSPSRTGLLVVLAIILGYCALSLVNTLLMAAPDRAGERRTLRLLGATHWQVLRATALETLIAVVIGVALAALCATVGVGGLWLTLLRVTGPIPIPVPWLTLAVITGGVGVLAVTTAACSASDTKRYIRMLLSSI